MCNLKSDRASKDVKVFRVKWEICILEIPSIAIKS